MSFFEAIILGIIQGITEFLPISSSGHLIILEHYFGLKVEELKIFDVFVHVGTLGAILIYFRKDFEYLLKTFWEILKGKGEKKGRKEILYLILATIPAVLAGVSLESHIDSYFRGIKAVAVSMMIMSFVFYLAEFIFEKTHKSKGQSVNKWWKAFIIGLFQMLALIPGVSRSGSTISAGLFLGIERQKAARFSFLLGSIAISGAGFLSCLKLIQNPLNSEIGAIQLLLGFMFSLIAGYFSVAFFMNFLKKRSLKLFSIYLFILALLLITIN